MSDDKTQAFYESQRQLVRRCPKCGYDDTHECDEAVMEDGDYYYIGVVCPKCGFQDDTCGPVDAPFLMPGSNGSWDRLNEYQEVA